VGLPELITGNAKDFEEMAVGLAQNPQRLAALRRKLDANKRTMPLFDTDRFRRNLEAAYETMLTRWQDGLPSDSFAVAP